MAHATRTGHGNWDGRAYSDVAEMQRVVGQQTIALLEWRGDEQVLDLGCGDGWLTEVIARQVPRGSVHGVDVSPGQLAHARAEHDLPNVTYELGDAAHLAFSNRFDVLTSLNTLHWVHRLEDAVAGMARALRPGGRMALRFVVEEPRPSIEDVIVNVCALPRWRAMFQGFVQPFEHRTADQWRALLAGAGLEVTWAQVDDTVWDFVDRQGFATWCGGTLGQWFAVMPHADREAFVNDVLAHYVDVTGREGLFLFTQMQVLAAAPGRTVS